MSAVKASTVAILLVAGLIISASRFPSISIRAPLILELQNSRPYLSFSFNEGLAIRFYSQILTTIGLEEEYPGSHTIWLADDQALDYYALLSIYNATHDSSALKLAQQINSSIVQWGGFYKYWNPVFEVIGSYPDTSEVTCGASQTIGAFQGYMIKASVFKTCPDFPYSLFADLLAYRILLDLHTQNWSLAESEFSTLNSKWDGQGINDEPFQVDSTRTYQSYKLADYVIAWYTLNQNPSTRQFAQNYVSNVTSAARIMSSLQSNCSSVWPGGVWTGYHYSNGQLVFGNGVSLENGETTSLFVLATQLQVTTVSATSTSPPPSCAVLPNYAVPIFAVAALLVTLILLTRRRKPRAIRPAKAAPMPGREALLAQQPKSQPETAPRSSVDSNLHNLEP